MADAGKAERAVGERPAGERPAGERAPGAPRVRLVPLDPDDPAHVEAVFDMHSRLEIVRWLDDPPWHPMETRDEARALIERRCEREARLHFDRLRGILDADTGEVVGTAHIVLLGRRDGTSDDDHHIGWALRPAAQGRGYVTAAARLLAAEVFAEGLDMLYIDMWADNEPSAAVARRLGAADRGVADDPWYHGTSRVFELRPADLQG